MDKKKNRRRRIIISRKFQHKFIYDYLLLIISCTIFIGMLCVLYYYYKYQYGNAIFKNYWIAVNKGETVKVKTIFNLIIPVIVILFVILMAFMSIFISVLSLYYSHRIAGPVYRFKKTIESICSNDFSMIVRLRRKDKLKDIEIYLNKLIDFLNQKMLLIKKYPHNMYEKIREAKEHLNKSPNDIANIKKIINKVEEINSELHKHLNETKIKNTE